MEGFSHPGVSYEDRADGYEGQSGNETSIALESYYQSMGYNYTGEFGQHSSYVSPYSSLHNYPVESMHNSGALYDNRLNSPSPPSMGAADIQSHSTTTPFSGDNSDEVIFLTLCDNEGNPTTPCAVKRKHLMFMPVLPASATPHMAVKNVAPVPTSTASLPSREPRTTKKMKQLQDLPTLREIPWRQGQHWKTFDNCSLYQRFAIILASRGQVAVNACELCAGGHGRFSLCVVQDNHFDGACASCVFKGKGTSCSIKRAGWKSREDIRTINTRLSEKELAAIRPDYKTNIFKKPCAHIKGPERELHLSVNERKLLQQLRANQGRM